MIPFALPIRWYPDSPEGKRDFECRNGKILLKYGSLDPDGMGYVYKVRADTFEKIDEWQWVSRESCSPVEVMQIQATDCLDRVEFSPEAAEIMNHLYSR